MGLREILPNCTYFAGQLLASEDEGKTFPIEKLISADYAAYSDLTILKDGSVGVLWERGVERGYQFITFTRIERDWVVQK